MESVATGDMSRTNTLFILALAVACTPAIAQEQAGGPQKTGSAESSPKKVYSDAKLKEAQVKLAAKSAEMSDLRKQSVEIMSKMADVAKDGTLVNTKAGTDLLQELVEQMKQVNERLVKLEEEIEEIKGWIEGQNEALPIMTNDILDLKRLKNGSYMMMQFRTQTKDNTSTSGFRNRRIRLGQTLVVDPKTSFKVSFDLGTGANQTAAQLRDAFLIYDSIPSDQQVGLQFAGGQQPLKLGYELERSSSEREFPERALYNQRHFDGERSTGVNMAYGLNPNVSTNFGVFNSLTYNDPEQRAFGNDSTGRKLAVVAGVRYHADTFEVGLHGMEGYRPVFRVAQGTGGPNNVDAPSIRRRFINLDATWLPKFLTGLTLRGEFFYGSDRNNLGASTNGTSRNSAAAFRGVYVKGFQAQAGYALDNRNQINVRYEWYDPDVNTTKNGIQGVGVGYQYALTAQTKFGLYVESFKEPTRRYNVITARTTFKF